MIFYHGTSQENWDVIQKKNISSIKTANQEKKITITETNFHLT